jgi:hypothetical protein
MCTLCLSDMGELRDDWLRPPRTAPVASSPAASEHGDAAVLSLLAGLARPQPPDPIAIKVAA